MSASNSIVLGRYNRANTRASSGYGRSSSAASSSFSSRETRRPSCESADFGSRESRRASSNGTSAVYRDMPRREHARGAVAANRPSREATSRGRTVSGRAASEARRRAAGEGEDHRRTANVASQAQGVLAWAMEHRALSIAFVAIVALALMLYPPLKALYGASRTNALLSTQLSSVTATNDTLQGEVDNLMTREGIEDEARRRGYVTEGDTPVDMSGVEDSGGASSDSTVSTDESASTASDPWYVSALDFIFGYNPADQGVSQ